MPTSATLGLHPRYREISRNGQVRGSAIGPIPYERTKLSTVGPAEQAQKIEGPFSSPNQASQPLGFITIRYELVRGRGFGGGERWSCY